MSLSTLTEAAVWFFFRTIDCCYQEANHRVRNVYSYHNDQKTICKRSSFFQE